MLCFSRSSYRRALPAPGNINATPASSASIPRPISPRIGVPVSARSPSRSSSVLVVVRDVVDEDVVERVVLDVAEVVRFCSTDADVVDEEEDEDDEVVAVALDVVLDEVPEVVVCPVVVLVVVSVPDDVFVVVVSLVVDSVVSEVVVSSCIRSARRLSDSVTSGAVVFDAVVFGVAGTVVFGVVDTVVAGTAAFSEAFSPAFSAVASSDAAASSLPPGMP